MRAVGSQLPGTHAQWDCKHAQDRRAKSLTRTCSASFHKKRTVDRSCSQQHVDITASDTMEATRSLDRSPLHFLHLIQQLKHLPRTGWLRTVEQPESVASHSFRLALLSLFTPVGLASVLFFLSRMLIFPPEKGLDRSRCMFIGLIHDLAESVVGDIPTYAGVPKGACSTWRAMPPRRL